MTLLRDIKRQARRDLHEHMLVPALYLVPAAAPGTYEEPVNVTVRLHIKFDALGDMKGTNFHYAERQEVTPKIIFMRDQIDKPARHAVISVELGEAYRVDNILPPDDITVAAEVLRLSAAEAAGLPLPDEGSHIVSTEDGYYVDDGLNNPYDPDDA